MSDHSFISLGFQLGAARLTISAESVDELGEFLGALTEVEDPEGSAPIDAICDSITAINAVSVLKGLGSERISSAPAPVVGNAPQSTLSGETCQHGPMKYKEGTGKNGPYKAYFCQAPFGKPKCNAIFIND